MFFVLSVLLTLAVPPAAPPAPAVAPVSGPAPPSVTPLVARSVLAPAVGLGVGVGCGWRAPVSAPVIDPFRPPSHAYGPGNRGLEYGAEIGAPVTAVADGTITYAGVVAGRRYVVVTHQGGLRSTLGPLATSTVVSGQGVSGGQRLGTAGAGFHLTARAGDHYIDPQPLLEGRCGRVRLTGPLGSAAPGVHFTLVSAPMAAIEHHQTTNHNGRPDSTVSGFVSQY